MFRRSGTSIFLGMYEHYKDKGHIDTLEVHVVAWETNATGGKMQASVARAGSILSLVIHSRWFTA